MSRRERVRPGIYRDDERASRFLCVILTDRRSDIALGYSHECPGCCHPYFHRYFCSAKSTQKRCATKPSSARPRFSRRLVQGFRRRRSNVRTGPSPSPPVVARLATDGRNIFVRRGASSKKLSLTAYLSATREPVPHRGFQLPTPRFVRRVTGCRGLREEALVPKPPTKNRSANSL
jgi:hypothetical protein